MRSPNLIEAIGNTPLVELPTYSPRPGVRIFAKLEGANPTGSVKDRIARSMMRAAHEAGALTTERSILEPTSGNTGISLAMVAGCMGYRFTAVMPDNVSPERTELLRAYGAEIIRDLPEVTHFVAGLGTGGTLMGTGRRLKEHNPAVKVIAAAPAPDDAIQGLRALEEGFVPPILDLDKLDARLMVGGEESFRTTAAMLRREGVFAGVSSGAVLAAAVRVAARLEEGNIVCLFADGGWKYLSTGLWTRDYKELEGTIEGKIWW